MVYYKYTNFKQRKTNVFVFKIKQFKIPKPLQIELSNDNLDINENLLNDKILQNVFIVRKRVIKINENKNITRFLKIKQRAISIFNHL